MTATTKPPPPVPRRGRGRPPVGPSLHLRLPTALRAHLDCARLPGEGVAEAARRLLAVALSPVLADALALAVARWDDLAGATCLDCADLADGEICAAHAEVLDLADTARTALAALDGAG